MRSRPVEERFWEKVNKRGVEDCWNWTAATYTGGYGAINIKAAKCAAHRVSWRLHNGKIPLDEGGNTLHVLHTCDNRLCVNPAHLFLGTHQDNMTDRKTKGRSKGFTIAQRGEGNARAILKLSEVEKIKHLLTIGELTQTQIGRIFDVSNKTIHNIATGHRWAHV